MDPRILNRRDGINRTQTPPRMVSGTPPLTPRARGFRDSRDFQDQLIAVRSDTSTTARERKAAENELVARRRSQLGED